MSKSKNTAGFPDKPRKKKRPSYSTFHLNRRIKVKNFKPLPSAWKLWKTSLQALWMHKKTIGLFLLLYSALYIIFVRGLSGGVNLTDLKDQISETTGADVSGLFSSTALFGVLLTTSNATSSEVAALYQSILLVMGSLAFIWLLRQLTGSPKIRPRIRDSFYKGMQQLVPFILVLFVIMLEFIPMAIGSFLLNTVQSNGLASNGTELFGFVVVAILLAILSLYLVSGSLAAIYVVTLPNMTPMRALRSSHKLLALHRWSVLRKLILLVLFVVGFAALIFIPLLLVIPTGYEYVAESLFFACTMATFAIVHTYLYTLYRSLL